jgi:hypothetical protein
MLEMKILKFYCKFYWYENHAENDSRCDMWWISNYKFTCKKTRCFNLPLTIFQQQFFLVTLFFKFLWSQKKQASNQWVNKKSFKAIIMWVREIAIKETFSYSADFHRLIDDLKILWILNFLQSFEWTQYTHNTFSACFLFYYRPSEFYSFLLRLNGNFIYIQT